MARAAMAPGGSPVNVTNYLRGIQFPVTRDDLIRHARNQGADDDIIQVLNGMPDRRYNDMADVMGGYGEFGQEDEEFDVNVDDDTEDMPVQQQRRRA